VSIRMESGKTISVVQEVVDEIFFQAGERVRLLELNGVTRITY
jgi:outer membrane lipoprotein SlyB